MCSVWHIACYLKINCELKGTEIQGEINEYKRRISKVVHHCKEPGVVCRRHRETHRSIWKLPPYVCWIRWKVSYNLEGKVFFVENRSVTQNFWRTTPYVHFLSSDAPLSSRLQQPSPNPLKNLFFHNFLIKYCFARRDVQEVHGLGTKVIARTPNKNWDP